MTRVQRPIGSGFGVTSTAEEVIRGIDLTGKTAIVTGGDGTLGRETASALSNAGATVIIATAKAGETHNPPGSQPDLKRICMDLMDPDSIDRFADDFLATSRPLHMLVNNAGIMAWPLTRDARGFEAQFSTNHLGHFQLTRRLMPALQAAQGARVVALSSRGHQRSGIDFDDWNFERRDYDPYVAYGQSKTANVLFALHLDQIGRSAGIRAFSVHPGNILSNLARYIPHEDKVRMGAITADGTPIIDPSRNFKTPEQGAATTIWCATSPLLEGMGGLYCENCDVAQAVDEVSSFGVTSWATDPVAAERLWALTDALI